MYTLKEHQELRALQLEQIIKNYGTAYCAMETRTGKTATAFRVAEFLEKKNVLFVTKKKAISSARHDYVAFGFNKKFNLLVTNYEQLHNNQMKGWHTSNGFNESVSIDKFDFIVADEAHRLGSYPKPGLAAKNLRYIVSKTRADTLLMSATPTPESWSQIFHQLWAVKKDDIFRFDRIDRSHGEFYDWCRAGYVKVYEVDYNRVDAEGRKRKQKKYERADIVKVKSKIAPLFVTCTQAEAKFDFQVNERVIRVKPSASIEQYFETLNKNRYIVVNSTPSRGDTASKMLSKGHQLISGSIILDTLEGVLLDVTKAIAIRNDAAEHGYKKIAIYYKYKQERNAILRIFGDMVTEVSEDFQRGTRYPVFMSQVLSGREGVRIDKADALYIYNIDYAWLSYAQTKDRIQSMDRDKEPELVWVFSSINDGRSLEDRIYTVCMSKRKYSAAFYRNDFLRG